MILSGDAGRLVPCSDRGRKKRSVTADLELHKKQPFKGLHVGRLVILEGTEDLIAFYYNINIHFTYTQI